MAGGWVGCVCQARFVTPIRHCNVNPYGRVCHSVLGRDWTSDTRLSTVLCCLYGLLLNPDTSDPLDTDLVRSRSKADRQGSMS